jgi:hypothetical protein
MFMGPESISGRTVLLTELAGISRGLHVGGLNVLQNVGLHF